jgi:hypothetical protein
MRETDYEEIIIDRALNNRVTSDIKRPAKMTEKLLSEMGPGHVREEKLKIDFGRKAAPTASPAAGLAGPKKVA